MGQIDEILEKAKEEICDKYCKYPEQYKTDADEGFEKMWDEVCDKCPLYRI